MGDLEEVLHTEEYLGFNIYVAKWNWTEPEVEICCWITGYVYLHNVYSMDWWNSRDNPLDEVLTYWKGKIDSGETY